MRKDYQSSYLNFTGGINNYQHDLLIDSEKFNRDLNYQSSKQHYNTYHKSDYRITHNLDWPIYNSTIFPEQGMSHKRQMAEMERKLHNKKLKERDFNFNHSATLYPYSFTEYERMKEKMHEKTLTEDKWLQNEISRMKMEDEIIQAKDKMRKKNEFSYVPLKIEQKKKVKEIFKEVRQQLKPAYSKPSEQDLEELKKNNKKYHLERSFVQESSINKSQVNHTKNLSSSQVFSSDSRSKKSQRRDKQRNAAIKDMISRHFPRKSPSIQNKHSKHKKESTTDRFRYISGSEVQNNSSLKTQYLNRYSYLFERQKQLGMKLKTQHDDSKVTNEMIDRAFVFDELKECESDFEEEGEEVMDIQKIEEKGQKRGYKNTIEILYEKLHKTPERQKVTNELSLSRSKNQSNDKKSKQKNHYNGLQFSNGHNKIRQKQAHKQPQFSKQFASKSQQQLNSSLDPQSPQAKDLNHSKLLQSSFYSGEMEIYNRSSDQHYPVFSPYSQHKHLPHETHEYLTASLERKKLTKHWGALDTTKKQNEFRHPHHINVKDLIVDEIEKKKISNKLHQQNNLTFSQKFQHHHVQIIGNAQKQRQEHNVSGSHQNQNILTSSHQSSDFIVKNLKIELEILRQQLQEKNKKVIDLELELMQIKNSFVEKKEEKQDLSTTTKSRHQNEDSRKDVCLSEDQECQTVSKHANLQLSSHIMEEQILPDQGVKKQRVQELFKTKNQVKRLEEKLAIQEEAMGNFFEDIAMYQKLNSQLQNKIKVLQSQKGTK